MYFHEAVKVMEEDKKVKSESRKKNIHISDGIIYNEKNNIVDFNLPDFKASDWEIVKEKKKTLSDKIYAGSELHLSDVKRAIKDIFELSTKKMLPSEERAMMQKGIKKIVGDELI